MTRLYMMYASSLLVALLAVGCAQDGADGDESTDGAVGGDQAVQGSDAAQARDDGGAADASMTLLDSEAPATDGAVVDADQEWAVDGTTPGADTGLTPAADASPQAPDASVSLGNVPASCGAEGQGLTPVDCTAAGDDAADCVFSNHCMCSEGFECEAETMWPGTNECDPGSICVPIRPVNIGSDPTSCGSPDQGLVPVDCTSGGDVDANCVFSNHCSCSEGFLCEQSGTPGECAAGERCVPAP